MFKKKNNEFLQDLHIDRLQGQVENANFDANLARQSEGKAEDRTLRAIEGLVNLRQNYDRLLRDAKEKDHTIDLWVEHDKKQKAKIACMKEEIARLKDELAISEANTDGILAQRNALREITDKNVTLLSDSDQYYEDGTIKSNIRIIFEKAFDATARKFGITNPSSRRRN